MTDNNHPITPSDELIEQWLYDGQVESSVTKHISTQAARWGADQELEACCNWVDANFGQEFAQNLRLLHRPKPPSLKEQALEALDEDHADMQIQNYKLIRSVLESLPD